MITPISVKLMLEKFSASKPPHDRKTMQLAAVIHATDADNIVWCLEDLIQRIKDGGIGYSGSGTGYYGSITWASTELLLEEKK